MVVFYQWDELETSFTVEIVTGEETRYANRHSKTFEYGYIYVGF